MNLRPGQIAMLAGGALLLISSFLDWKSFGEGDFSFGLNAWDLGLSGLFLLVIAGIAIAVAALAAFAPQVKLPDEIVGFRRNQVVLVLGFAAFCWGFSIMLSEGGALGAILAWIASAAIVAGAYMEDSAGASSSASRPSGGTPTPF